ncbi:MAG: response regulator [Saprospiraceae bacterium]|nr:response regulator [Saprospiraceae bacterium]
MIAKTTISILLIDNSVTEANLTTSLLVQGNDQFKVYQADSIYEAIRIDGRRTLDVIVLELNLPEINGYKAFQECLAKMPHLPIVIYTQQHNEIIGVQAIRAGAQDYLIKGSLDARHLQRTVYFATQRYENTTQLTTSNNQITQRERKLREAQEIGGFGSWEMDILNQEIWGSPKFFELIGIQQSTSALSKRVYLDLVHPGDKEKVQDFFTSLIQSNQVRSSRHRLFVNGATVKQVEMTARIQIEESSQQVIALGVLSAVYERYETISELEDQQYSEKLTKLRDKVLHDLSFHIRTPLYSMVNFLYLLEDSPMKIQNKEAFQGLKYSLDELQQHINQLITFSLAAEENASQTVKSFDLRKALQMMEKMLDFRRDHHPVYLDIKLDQKLPRDVLGDQTKLIQVFYNLFDLFLNLSLEPRRVAVRIKAETTDPDWINLLISCRDPQPVQSEVDLNEWNTESGLIEHYQDSPDNENLAKINLITMEKMVRSMGGSYKIPREQSNSLKLAITLPMQLVQSAPQVSATQDWIEPLRILLVEDHFLNQIATKNVLHTWSSDLTVDIAENGLVAVDKFKAHEYDMILMDIQMPVMNGLMACKKIRETSSVPIIALSAYASEQEAEKCIRAGFNDYLAKPFKPEELKHKVFRLASLVR